MTAKAYRTSAAYDGSLAAADWCERHRWRVLMLGAPLVFGLLTAVATVVLESFPNSGDEYAYLYQARTLAEGRLTNPLPAAPEFFETIYIAHDRGRAYGTFPIGWPLLLAAAQVAGVPAVVVAPLLGVVTLVLMYLVGRQLYGPRAGMLAAAVTASCPFFIFNAASYFSHTWCGCLLLAAMLTAILALRRHLAFALAAGFLIGWAVLTRYLTGALVGVAIGVWLMRHAGGRRLAVAALVAGGGVPWLAFLAWHNAAMTGSAWSLTTLPVTLSLWFADGVLTRGPDILATQVLRLLLWTPPALMVVYAVYLRRAPSRSASRVGMAPGGHGGGAGGLRQPRRQSIRAALLLRSDAVRHSLHDGQPLCGAALRRQGAARPAAVDGRGHQHRDAAGAARLSRLCRRTDSTRAAQPLLGGASGRPWASGGRHRRPRRFAAVDGRARSHSQRLRPCESSAVRA
jgi:hypothetical protein